MLAFDIETTGLKAPLDRVTVVCTEDLLTGARRAYEFGKVSYETRGHDNTERQMQALRNELISAFNSAKSLCAFNGIRFDIPFLQVALGIDESTIKQWIAKTTDILEESRKVYQHTFKLDTLCAVNSIETKSGDGLQAITFANENRWEELRLYCEQDVKILCDLYRVRYLTLPPVRHTGVKHIVDLKDWTRPGLYDDLQAQQKHQGECASLGSMQDRMQADASAISSTLEQSASMLAHVIANMKYLQTISNDGEQYIACLDHIHLHEKVLQTVQENLLQVALNRPAPTRELPALLQ